MSLDAECARLCLGIYTRGPTIVWDYLDPGLTDGVCWGIASVGDISVVTFRGSVTLRDWWLDFDAIANPWSHDDIGPVHPGFLLGIEQVVREAHAFVPTDRKIAVTGHSLGAGRAAVAAALFIGLKRPPVNLTVFGEPKPGFAKLSALIGGLPGATYVNGAGAIHDPVTDVPLTFPPEEYVHSRLQTIIHEPPTEEAVMQHGPFAWHDIALYERGVPT